MNKVLLCIFFLLGAGIISAQTGPASIGDTLNPSSLKAWYMADQGIQKNRINQVSTWKDLSYYKNDLLSTPNYLPKYGIDIYGSYINFTNNTQLKTLNSTTDFKNDSSTIFVVASGLMTGSLYSLATKNSFNNEMLFLNNKSYHHTSSGRFRYLEHQCVGSLSDSNVRAISNTFEGGTSINYFNNGLISSSLTSVPGVIPIPFTESARELKLGYRYNGGPQEFFRGKVYEFIYFDEVLSDRARIAVENYLRCKYNINYTTCTAFSSSQCNREELSIEETVAVEKVSFKLYPNPTSSQLNLVVDEAWGATAFQLVNMMGQVVKHYLITAKEQQIDVQQLPKGVYFLRLLKQQRIISSAKFIKQ